MRLAGMMRQDLRFQWRHHFYPVYAGITAMYVVILLCLPSAVRPVTALFMIFSDTAVLGFFFIGGIILLERSEQLLEFLFITPLTVREYILSKTVTLSVLALLCSLAVLLPAGVPSAGRLGVIVLGVITASVLFLLVGVIIAVRVPDINHYFLWSLVFIVPVVPAVLEFVGLFSCPWIYCIPFRGVLEIVRLGISGGTPLKTVLVFGSLAPWLVLCFLLAEKSLKKAVQMRGGEKSWIRF